MLVKCTQPPSIRCLVLTSSTAATLGFALAIISALSFYYQCHIALTALMAVGGGALLLSSLFPLAHFLKTSPRSTLLPAPSARAGSVKIPVISLPPSEAAENRNGKAELEQQKVNLGEQLAILKRNSAQDTPAYLTELEEQGFLHLCLHLHQMRTWENRLERRDDIRKIPFSHLAHIVLETREAIIQKVEAELASHGDYENLVFLLGGTGAGKTTTLCFLRGDEMELQGTRYHSKADSVGMIGSELADSCTFLPNIGKVDQCLIVDFPGFEDSRGPLVALGMELALTALLKKFPAKVLLLESLANTEGCFAQIARLGRRLERLITNKQACLLGLTKYAQQCHYIKLNSIEEQQREDLAKPTIEETRLKAQVKYLPRLISERPDEAVSLQAEQEKKTKKLHTLEQERLEKLNQPLPDTEEKSLCRREIALMEAQIAKEAGLSADSIIRFNDLADSQCLTYSFQQLASAACVSVSPPHLDPEIEDLIMDRFEKDLMQRLESLDYRNPFENFESFKEAIQSSSLIGTIAQSAPEIGTFFRLAEMDPGLVRECDRILIRNTLEKYKKAVIGVLCSAIDTVVQRCPSERKEELLDKLSALREFLLGLEGSDPKKHENWQALQIRNIKSPEELKALIQLPKWLRSVLQIPSETSANLLWLNSLSRERKDEFILSDTLLASCAQEVDQMFFILKELITIERMVNPL